MFEHSMLDINFFHLIAGKGEIQASKVTVTQPFGKFLMRASGMWSGTRISHFSACCNLWLIWGSFQFVQVKSTSKSTSFWASAMV